jgi:hypothetical protein
MFAELPAEVQRQARRAYRVFRQNPNQPSLRFKPVHPTRPIYSVRIGPGYRAVGILESDEVVWYWIGSHADYDKLLSQSRRRP